jgi:hypothetical protein
LHFSDSFFTQSYVSRVGFVAKSISLSMDDITI